MSDATEPVPTDAQMQRLVDAHAAYKAAVPEIYDEVLHEVTERISDTGSIGKADIGALLFWKRLRSDTRWASELHLRPDRDVRGVTSRAAQAVRDEQEPLAEAARHGRAALTDLPGFSTSGDALASALLATAAPDRMAVYDKRAHAGLTLLGIELDNRPRRYSRYMGLLDTLTTAVNAKGHEWRPRDGDIALYWLGGACRLTSRSWPGRGGRPMVQPCPSSSGSPR